MSRIVDRLSERSVLSTDVRAVVRGRAEPLARAFGRVGLTPNHLTFIGFGVAVVAAGAAWAQAWLAAGLLVLFGAIFDLFDGTLARATGRTSRLGAFYDSVFDRAGEGIVYVGVLMGCLVAGFTVGAILTAWAATAAFLVSYTRAKSEGLGFTPGTGMANVGLAPREVRTVILVVALIGTAVGGGLETYFLDAQDWRFGILVGTRAEPWLADALSVLAILASITVVQRILHVRKQAAEDRA